MKKALRADLALASLNTTARKVYDAVPIQESWSIQQIGDEMNRQGSAPVYGRIQGSLAALEDAGLVIRVATSGAGHAHGYGWQRAPQTPRPPREHLVLVTGQTNMPDHIATITEDVMPDPEQPGTARPTPLDVLANQAAGLRRVAEDLRERAAGLDKRADAIDAAALDAAAAMEFTTAEREQFQQFKTMLRNFTNP